MTKKIGYLLAGAVLLVLSLTLTAAASPTEKEVVRIAPFHDEVTIGPDQVGEIRWGWGCCSRGLTEDWINATLQHYTLKFNGEVIQEVSAERAERYWGAPEVQDPGHADRCVWPAQNTWAAFWEFGKLQLTGPGDYELDVYIELLEPLIDGYDWVPPRGRADWYDGVMFDKTIVIHVVEE